MKRRPDLNWFVAVGVLPNGKIDFLEQQSGGPFRTVAGLKRELVCHMKKYKHIDIVRLGVGAVVETVKSSTGPTG